MDSKTLTPDEAAKIVRYALERDTINAYKHVTHAIRILLEGYETAVKVPSTGIGDLSDGYHTFNDLYYHRAILFSVICNSHPDICWKAMKHHDGNMYPDMFIVGINTPEGQATYHYDINPYWQLFRVKELDYAPAWDGHTPEQAIWRIGTLGWKSGDR